MAADDEKTVIKQLLDADDDGKLSLEDAKAIAAKMAASARKRIVTLLDEDGDGEISWAEIEGGARGAFHRCEEAVTRAWRVLAPHKTKLLAGRWYYFLLPRREFQVHHPLLGLLRYDGLAARQASTHGTGGLV